MTFLFTLVISACDPAELLASLTPREAVRCELTQSKKSALFRRALLSTGRIAATRNAAFRFETLGPTPSTLVVSGGRAVLVQDGKRESLPLASLPKVNAFLAAFSGLFVGSGEALLQSFTATAKCEAKSARIALHPKDTALDAITSLVLVLAGGELRRVVLTEKNGDSSELVLFQCTADGVNPKLFE